MSDKMVLFAIGPDRPGLVSAISQTIHKCGGNLEDSRMSMLGGDFALMVLFTATEEVNVALSDKLPELEQKNNVKVQLKRSTPRGEGPIGDEVVLEAIGHDRPGIVATLTGALAREGVNVVALDTSLVHMAFHGTPMFKVKARLQVPRAVDRTALRAHLEEACEELEMLLELSI